MLKSGAVILSIILCLLAIDIVSSLTITCNNDMVQDYIHIGSKHYFIWGPKVSWLNGAHICRRYGGDLALFESAKELEDVSNYLISRGYDSDYWLWTSGSDQVSNRQFVSIVTGMPLPYTNWSYGQPDNAGFNEHCVHIWLRDGTFKMNDWICTEKAHVLCESQSRTRCYNTL